MRSRKPGTRGQKATTSTSHGVPVEYQELLRETLPGTSDDSERPIKRRRTGRRDAPPSAPGPSTSVALQNDTEEDDDVEFENVLDREIFGAENNDPPKKQQTAYRDSDEESGGSDIEVAP